MSILAAPISHGAHFLSWVLLDDLWQHYTVPLHRLCREEPLAGRHRLQEELSPLLLTHSEGYDTWSVCVSVCLSTAILALQATRRPMSNTNVFRTTQTWKIKGRFSWNDCVREICRENKRKSQYAYSHLLPSTNPLARGGTRSHPRRPCIDSRFGMLSYSVASPCQTLRDQLAWRPRVYYTSAMY